MLDRFINVARRDPSSRHKSRQLLPNATMVVTEHRPTKAEGFQRRSTKGLRFL